ncbi:MAG: hypothetical protein OXC11_06960 [Rhodospirillales bacterium]|nr:hypothetical protein [Alphaproteobacteria bacterium]MCY4430120.1 hypothetical protein [Rhodospirillales bacterium]
MSDRRLPAFLVVTLLAAALVSPAQADPTAQLIEVYKRSMLSWSIDYDTLRPNRAGAACIPWESLDDAFLEEGIFEALGYAWQVAGEPVAARAAMEGCERMRRGHQLVKICTCELLLYNDEVRLILPETPE